MIDDYNLNQPGMEVKIVWCDLIIVNDSLMRNIYHNKWKHRTQNTSAYHIGHIRKNAYYMYFLKCDVSRGAGCF